MLWDNGLIKYDHNLKNIFLKADGRTPVIADFESASSIEINVDGVNKVLHQISYIFWEFMEEKKFNSMWSEGCGINEKIEKLTGRLEKAEQQK